MTKHFYFSLDVDPVEGSNTAIPDFLEFSKHHGLQTSFFVSGKFADLYPDETKLIATSGFELGIHGWDHGFGSLENYYTNSYDIQKESIGQAIRSVETAAGIRPIMNRCPDLHVGETTLRVLKEGKIKIDSSVPAKRL